MKPVNLPTMIFCLFCALFLFANNSSAQQSTGSIRGTVTDYVGAVVLGATITLKLKVKTTETISESYWKTSVSNDAGEYKFENMSPGIYEITVDSQFIGLSYKNENVRITANESTKMDTQLTYGGDCEKSGGKTIELNDADKAEIVNQILENDILKKKISDYGLLVKQKGAIILSTENIKTDWIKPLKEINLKFMSESEIQDRADKSGDFLYLSFDKFKIIGECIIVTFTNSWAVGKNSGMGYLSGGGSVYLYHKESGKLIGKSIGGWIS
jgi:Carboxypeptidase regulatory-like domain